MEKVILDGKRFVNESGRQLILHGVNVLCREAKLGHFYPDFSEAFPFFRRMGFNLLRFGIFWNGAEPQPGVIDREYLKRVKEIVKTAESYGIYIILDMHQDLFAQKFIDGAPDWACLDEGLPHPTDCVLWYDAYLRSDAIIRAADNFWANKEASDGVGLLDHYEKMWEVIAETFSDCDNVIGFEPMNEPFMGSIAREAFGTATMKMLQKNPEFSIADPTKVRPEEAAEFMGIVAARLQEFDRTTLMDFYRRISRAIRKHSDKAIVTGGNIYCSTDVQTGMEPLGDIPQIFAPHGYDSVVDSDRYDSFSRENVERIYQHKREDQDRLGLPAIIGEWGAFPSRDFTNDLIRHMNGILEENLWGDTYCEYRPGMEENPNFTALRKAYPMATGGTLRAFHYDEEKNSFRMEFDSEAGKETVVFCPFEPKVCDCSRASEWTAEKLDSGSFLCRITVSESGKTEISIRG